MKVADPGFKSRQSNSRTHPLNCDIVCLWLGSLEANSETKIFRQADFWGSRTLRIKTYQEWDEVTGTEEKEKLNCNEVAIKA